MDSAAYLKKQGWRGKGHSLDHTDRGIKNPLLVSKKVDVLGLGINKHAAVSDQWWLRAYDAGLKDFGTGKESTLSNVKAQGIHRGGLYGRFVRGEGVGGTIGLQIVPVSKQPFDLKSTKDKKRKRSDPSVEKEAKKNKLDKKQEKREKKAARAADVQMSEKELEHFGLKKKALSSEKLAQYEARASMKKITVEEYMKRREVKNKAQKLEKVMRMVNASSYKQRVMLAPIG